jgi:hypothetical protein
MIRPVYTSSRLHIAVVVVLLAFMVVPEVASASLPGRPAQSTSLHSLALKLSDVQRVYGSGMAPGSPSPDRKSTDFACADAPTISSGGSFTTSSGGALARNGLLSISGLLARYRDSAGPRCNFKFDLSTRKTLGATLGVVSKLTGIGDQAVLIRMDPSKKSPGPPVYALSARFIRGHYVALILVQMNRPVRVSDVRALAQAVDSRLKRGG